MITLPNGKICMNEQEAIQWLLDNYPIPFQCSANYAAGTEIGLGTIVNPTPAKVKIGSIIFFADSKVSTVVGVTSNSFTCSDQYNDLVDDIVYVSNVQLNASGHLIVTLSNGTNIDAGLIKQVTGFSINASQHLIVAYNDGTSTDLGAIFSGNITISGNLAVSGSISGTIPFETIKDSAGHNRFVEGDVVHFTDVTGLTRTYSKWSLSGSHLMVVVAGTLANGTVIPSGYMLGRVDIPQWIKDKIYPTFGNTIAAQKFIAYNSDGSTTQETNLFFAKGSNIEIYVSAMTLTDDRFFRVAFDLLIDNA